VVERLLTPEQTARARALGAAMRLGCDLSGRSAVLLGDASLGLEREELVLKVSAASADVVLGEPINKRAAQLAGVLGIPFKVKLR
jgi:exopolyphosphatase/guanosine-5'-triphosphate,3'-diphosphate pyrophosphatase